MGDIERMKQLIEQAQELVSSHTTHSKPEFKAWHLKMERFLNSKYGDKSIELKNFMNRQFAPRVYVTGRKQDISEECIRDLKTTILELEDYLVEEEENIEDSSKEISDLTGQILDKVFIVHGHDGELKEAVARLVERQGIETIILNERTNQGKTIIEKFEENSQIGAAIALFTSDDLGKRKDAEKISPRARQNVVFEAGYFMGKLGRNRVIIIADEGVELPSDLQGIVYTDKTDWKLDVCRELKDMNYSIDFNKLF